MSASARTRLVDEIRERKLSRNRNFELMSRPEYRSAMRLGRYLDAVARTVRRGVGTGALQAQVQTEGPDGVRLSLRHTRLRAEQQVHLHRAEWACLLRHHPDLAALLCVEAEQAVTGSEPAKAARAPAQAGRSESE